MKTYAATLSERRRALEPSLSPPLARRPFAALAMWLGLVVSAALAMWLGLVGSAAAQQDESAWLRAVGDAVVGVPLAVEPDHLGHVCAAWTFRTAQPCDPATFRYEGAMPAFVAELNALRAQGAWCGGVWHPPAPPVAWSWALQLAAIDQLSDQRDKGYFGHISPSGRTARDWARDRGYPYWVRDNLARGYPSVDSTLAAWLADPPHCEPLFDPETQDAAGWVIGDRWVLVMGWRGYAY